MKFRRFITIGFIPLLVFASLWLWIGHIFFGCFGWVAFLGGFVWACFIVPIVIAISLLYWKFIRHRPDVLNSGAITVDETILIVAFLTLLIVAGSFVGDMGDYTNSACGLMMNSGGSTIAIISLALALFVFIWLLIRSVGQYLKHKNDQIVVTDANRKYLSRRMRIVNDMTNGSSDSKNGRTGKRLS